MKKFRSYAVFMYVGNKWEDKLCVRQRCRVRVSLCLRALEKATARDN